MSESPVQTGGSVVTETSLGHEELPPSLYVETKRAPLVLELLEGVSAYMHFDMPMLSKEIDTLVLAEMRRLGLSDNHIDYQLVVDRALDKLDLPDDLDIYTKVEKLVRYLRIQHKLYSALKEKEDLMQADPLTLSAAKLKRYLELQHG